jgi:predicted nucleic acid-binding protein
MAVPIGGKVLLDTNVFIDFLRAGLHAEWVLGGHGTVIRFLSGVVLFELQVGADTPKRRKAVDKLQDAFPASRTLGVTPGMLSHAGRVFRALCGNAEGLRDRLGPFNDLLIALTAREIGATVVTSNVLDFRRIATRLPGLKIASP